MTAQSSFLSPPASMFFLCALLLAIVALVLVVWLGSRSRPRPVAGVRPDECRRMLADLAERAGMDAPRLRVRQKQASVAQSLHSDSRGAEVSVTSGLLERLDRSDIEAILAHELAHLRNRDADIRYKLEDIGDAVSLCSLLPALTYAFSISCGARRIRPAGLTGRLFMVAAVPPAVKMARQSIRRRLEFRADAHAAAIIGSDEQMAVALERLESVCTSGTGAGEQTPERTRLRRLLGLAQSKLADTHPPIPVRARRLRLRGGVRQTVSARLRRLRGRSL